MNLPESPPENPQPDKSFRETCSVICGHSLQVLRGIPDGCVDTCVTSPPYWNLRDYKGEPQIWDGAADCEHEFVESRRYTENGASKGSGEAFSEAGPENAKRLKEARWRVDGKCGRCGAWRGQLGLEPTPEMFVDHMVQIFREVRRVLRREETLWVNLGDSYAAGGRGGGGSYMAERRAWSDKENSKGWRSAPPGLKGKDLVGIPWMLAFALRADGWFLRSDIIWAKPNCMPESVTDRPTRAHEYIFLLSKSAKYYYDAAAIRNPPSPELIKQIEEGYNGHATKDFIAEGVQDASATKSRIIEGCRKRIDKQRGHSRRHAGFNDRWDSLSKEEQMLCGSNKRTVWTVAPANYTDAHFATYPPDLIKPCILAGSPPGGLVLDPFAGSGTTGQVAIENGRRFLGIELNPDYIPMIKARLKQPGLPL